MAGSFNRIWYLNVHFTGIKETYNTLNSRACEQDKTLKSQKELISDLEEKCARLNNQVCLIRANILFAVHYCKQLVL